LRKLVDEELVHQIPSSITPRCVQDSHKAYQIDFGNYVDWVKTKSADLSTLLNEAVLPSFPGDFQDTWSDYLIDTEQVEIDMVTCSHCEKKFRESHAVYKKLGACPHCGELAVTH
jgi:hypothetical protein